MQAPTGTVTIACSDIQGSTPLWAAAPKAMTQALELHDQLLRSLLERHGGYEFSAEGDALKVAFDSSIAALRWCEEVQLALMDIRWPQELLSEDSAADAEGFRGLRVRMGIHRGEPVCRVNPVTQRMDYFGPVVNLAARISSAPHGGQVIASRSVLDEVHDSLDSLIQTDLGAHHLRGIAHPIELVQLIPKPLKARIFPPLRTLQARRTNLVQRPSSFVGRKVELAMVQSRLRSQDTRLLTLLGPGGTGKTRLSQQAGLLLTDDFSGGVWFCDLSEARDVDGICAALAAALGLSITGRDSVVQLGNALLGRGPILVILDNFEQVVSHAPTTVGAWLLRAPEARFLISSRERIGIEAEVVQDLEPLPTPTDSQDWSQLIQNPGVLLFVERARKVRHDFQLDEHSTQDVAQIVRLLDGLPLAIELAAARSRTLRPQAILERLRDEDGFVKLKVLRGRDRDRQARQATIRGAIQWSWDLIEPWEKAALAQCSVFKGGFDLDAAEAVLELSGWDDAPDWDELIEELVDQSLLRRVEPAELIGEVRFEMLHTIQAFAREKLRNCDTPGIGSDRLHDEAHARHARWYAQLGEPDRLSELHGIHSRAILPRYQLELENLAAVVRRKTRLISSQDAVRAGLAAMELLDRQGPQRKAIELGELLLGRDDLVAEQSAAISYRHGRTLINVGQINEGRELLETVLIDAEDRRAGRLQTQVLISLSTAYRRTGDGQASAAAAKDALQRARDDRQLDLEGRVLSELGALYYRKGKYTEARNHLNLAAKRLRATNWARQLGMTLLNLGQACREQGAHGEARNNFLAALAIQEQVGAQRNQAAVHGALALLETVEGRHEPARHHYGLALQIQKELGNRRSEGILHGNLADLLLEQGDLETARSHLGECLRRAQETQARGVEGAFLGSLGELELRCGRLAEAAEAFEQGVALLRASKVPMELAKILCRRATLEAHRGDPSSADATLCEVESLAHALSLDSDSEILQKVHQIRVKIEGS
jgi:predicted ATPase/class 3 adenylate cyclase/Tfp pilus assembly protein PilF